MTAAKIGGFSFSRKLYCIVVAVLWLSLLADFTVFVLPDYSLLAIAAHNWRGTPLCQKLWQVQVRQVWRRDSESCPRRLDGQMTIQDNRLRFRGCLPSVYFENIVSPDRA